MSEHAGIGLVAIGRNEGERLRRCLGSIPQDVPIVYVDSASTDDSVAMARARGARVVELDMSKPFSAARARNEGAEALFAQNPAIEMIQFVDGDCELERGWLGTARQFLEDNKGVAAACGRRRERFPEASFYNELADREWNTPVGQAMACGGDALYRRSAFESVGGFDSAMVAGEEPELCSRLRAAGWTIWRLDAPMTIHDADMHHFKQWWMRAIRSGFGYAQAFSRGEVGGSRLYSRELARAVFWTLGVVVAALVAGAVLGLAGLAFGPVAWGLQWARLALKTSAREAALLMLGKFAEIIGAGRFLALSLRGKRGGAIFYK